MGRRNYAVALSMLLLGKCGAGCVPTIAGPEPSATVLAAVVVQPGTTAAATTVTTPVTPPPVTVAATTVTPTTAANTPVITAPELPTASQAHFATLPPGSALPSDLGCAERVRSTPEIRPANATYNHTVGTGSTAGAPRVTGNYAGTTDEIIQWVACKWGLDEDIIRAQIAKESWWYQTSGGDYTTDQSACHPLLRTSSGPCPESIGLVQVRYLYHSQAFVNNNAINSSAYNLDYTYSLMRACFDGESTWLNTVARGAQYTAGDVWGCLGVWYSGRWYTDAANGYIAAVQQNLNTRVWASSSFRNS